MALVSITVAPSGGKKIQRFNSVKFKKAKTDNDQSGYNKFSH